MITVFNRKLLFQNTDATAAAAVWSRLKKEKIEYSMQTKTGTSSLRRMATQQKNIHLNAGGIPASWTDPPRDYLYLIYVKKSDYAAAKDLCEI